MIRREHVEGGGINGRDSTDVRGTTFKCLGSYNFCNIPFIYFLSICAIAVLV